MGWNPVNDAKKWINKIKDSGNDAVKKVLGATTKAEQEIERDIERGEKEIEKDVKRGARAIAQAQVKAIQQLEEEVPRIAQKVLTEIGDSLTTLWTAGIIDGVVDLAQHAVPNRKVPLRLSFIEIQVDINDKIDVLQDLSRNLPKSRADIIAMVHRLTDDDVILIHIDARLVTSALGFDVAIPVKVELLTDEADKIFKRYGL